jgi:cytochrome c oxidase subunit II
MLMTSRSLIALLLCKILLLPLPAFASEVGPWDWTMQQAASPTAERIHAFHDMLLWIIAGIVLFVMLLLAYVILRFNKRANPKPAVFSHNVLIEVLWTVVPVIILIVIVVPSFKLLYYVDRVQNPEMTLKITGYQWYWGYEYPDSEGPSFNAYMIADNKIDAAKNQKRLLSTDNAVVLPVDTDIQILVTAADVLHSWAVPALGIKIDAVPGRLNETWVRITKPGVYYGQCSELCGKDHSYMPVEIHAVPKEEFKAWLETAKKEFSELQYDTDVKLAYLEAR